MILRIVNTYIHIHCELRTDCELWDMECIQDSQRHTIALTWALGTEMMCCAKLQSVATICGRFEDVEQGPRYSQPATGSERSPHQRACCNRMSSKLMGTTISTNVSSRTVV